MFRSIPFAALSAVAILCSALGCIVPFAALSALAALALSRRGGLAVIAAAWACNQAIGFLYKHYPHDPSTIAWSIGLGVAAFAAYGIARLFARNPAAAFAGAFIAFELTLVLFSVRLGGWGAYAPRILITLFAINAAWFAAAIVSGKAYRALGLDAAR